MIIGTSSDAEPNGSDLAIVTVVLQYGVFPSQNDGAVAKAMLGTGKFEVWVKGIVLTRVVMLLNSELPVIAYVTRMKIQWKKSSEWLIQ